MCVQDLEARKRNISDNLLLLQRLAEVARTDAEIGEKNKALAAMGLAEVSRQYQAKGDEVKELVGQVHELRGKVEYLTSMYDEKCQQLLDPNFLVRWGRGGRAHQAECAYRTSTGGTLSALSRRRSRT